MNKTDQQKNNTYIDYWTKTGKSSKEANQSIKIAKTVTYTDKSGTKRTRTTFQHPILKDITFSKPHIRNGSLTEKEKKERFDKADLIIWLDYSTLKQLHGILKRYFTTRNSERPEIPGCKERLEPEFIKYVLTYNKKKRPVILDYLKDVPKEKVLIFKHQKDLNAWLKDFTNNPNVLSEIK